MPRAKRAARRADEEDAKPQFFVMRTLEMITSPAWAAASDQVRRLVERLEVELMQRGYDTTEPLTVTFVQFEASRVWRKSLVRTIREAEGLGLIRVISRGRPAKALALRQSGQFELTYVKGFREGAPEPTHDWRKITSEAEALRALARARAKAKAETCARRRGRAVEA